MNLLGMKRKLLPYGMALGGGAVGGGGGGQAANYNPSAGSQGMMGGKSSGAGQGGYGGAPGFGGQQTAQNQPSSGQSPYGMPPSSVNSTTQQDMMGGNRGSGQSFGQTMQGMTGGGKSSGLGQGGYGGAPGFGDRGQMGFGGDPRFSGPMGGMPISGTGGELFDGQGVSQAGMGGQQGNIGLGGFNGTFSPEALAFQQANPQNAEANRMAQNAFTGMQSDMTRQSNNMAQNPQYTQGMGSLGGFGQQGSLGAAAAQRQMQGGFGPKAPTQDAYNNFKIMTGSPISFDEYSQNQGRKLTQQGMGGQQQIPNFGGQQQQMQQQRMSQQQFNPYQQQQMQQGMRQQQFNPYQQQRQQFNPYQQQQFNPYQQQQFNPYQQQFGRFGQQQQSQDMRGLSELLSLLRGRQG